MTRAIFIIALCYIMLSHIETLASSVEKCFEKHQMPLDEKRIKTERRQYERIQFQHFGGLPEATVLENNGGTLLITVNFTKNIPTISLGPFNQTTYRFDRMYFEWLNKSRPEYGYENMTIPAELHLVFYNAEYNDIMPASTKPNGITILSYGIKINPTDYAFELLADHLSTVSEEFSKTTVPYNQQLPLFDYTADDIFNYYVYHGSWPLTYCSEDVIWVDFDDPILMHPRFVKEMQELYSYDHKPLTSKVRAADPPKGPVYRVTYQMNASTEVIDVGAEFINFISHSDTFNAAYTISERASGEVAVVVIFIVIRLTL